MLRGLAAENRRPRMTPDFFPNLQQELGGWYYRVLATDADCRVLAVGTTLAEHWFADVATTARFDALVPTGSDMFDLVLLHLTLGGCTTLSEAARKAYGLLHSGGKLFLVGENALRGHGLDARRSSQPPRATKWGYRRALRNAGFTDIALYAMYPHLSNAIYLVDEGAESTRAFFRQSIASQHRTTGSLIGALLPLVDRLNLSIHLYPGFLVEGRKC